MKKSNNNGLLFLESSLRNNQVNVETQSVIDWIREQNDKVHVRISKQKFTETDCWFFTDNKEAFKHKTGKFFSVVGIRVETNWGSIRSWDQPIIDQPEVGYLGFITKEFNGVLHFLVQAKIEPGNVNYVQLSPTLQATRSNYTQVHKGRKPLYLEFFQKAKPEQIMLDQLQSEQGSRFLKKRNRNIIIKVERDVPVYDNFIWLTLRQLKELLRYDNFINMDTRTVISGIGFNSVTNNEINSSEGFYKYDDDGSIGRKFLRSALEKTRSVHTMENILSTLTHIKSVYDLEVKKIPLHQVQKWHIGDYEIVHNSDKFFKVIAVDVEIGNREVVRWSQPMIEPTHEDLCAFICKEINGVLHLAVQMKLECGNYDIVEFAPTVQCMNYNYKQNRKDAVLFLDYVLQMPQDKIIFDTWQSEEGGRFYREQNRNMIVIADDEFPVELPPNYIWMTLQQLHLFLKFNNFVNIQARSLIAAISYE